MEMASQWTASWCPLLWEESRRVLIPRIEPNRARNVIAHDAAQNPFAGPPDQTVRLPLRWQAQTVSNHLAVIFSKVSSALTWRMAHTYMLGQEEDKLCLHINTPLEDCCNCQPLRSVPVIWQYITDNQRLHLLRHPTREIRPLPSYCV